LLDGNPNTLYLIAPVDRQEQLQSIFTSILDEIRSTAYARGASAPLDPPLLFLLEELPNIAAIPALAQLASTGRGQGIQLLTILQDLSQLRERYGDTSARSIINNHQAKLILAGTSDPSTLDWAARVTGDQEISQLSTTSTSAARDSKTESSTWRPLAPAHLLREQPAGQGLLVYGQLPPAIIELKGGVAHPPR
jgi:type IV secretion system protein VirD4